MASGSVIEKVTANSPAGQMAAGIMNAATASNEAETHTSLLSAGVFVSCAPTTETKRTTIAATEKLKATTTTKLAIEKLTTTRTTIALTELTTAATGKQQHQQQPKHSISIPTDAAAAGNSRKLSMSGNTFQLTVNIGNAETSAPICFKQDGQRFGTSPRTFKFLSDATYKCRIMTKPPIEFQNVHLGGSDIRLVGSAGDYTAIWKTDGIDATRKGMRHDILFVINGPDGTLRRTFQTKFYALGDPHVDYGHKMESLQWTCEIDAPSGTITVKNEQVM